MNSRVFMLLVLILVAASQSAPAQRRVFTNEDIQSTPPAPPAQPATSAPAQPATQAPGQPARTAAAADARPVDENTARRAEAEKAIQRLEEIQIAIREAGDVFFDKIREGTADQPTINKWNQVRGNLVLASDELGRFISEARRNLPPLAAPAGAPAAVAPTRSSP